MRTPGRACGTCAAWEREKEVGVAYRGRCHRAAPQADPETHLAMWPITTLDEYCWKWLGRNHVADAELRAREAGDTRATSDRGSGGHGAG